MEYRTVMVTGSSSGIGLETARGLASRGDRVILACRNREKAETVRDAITEETGNPRIDVRIVDLGDLQSIRRFARSVDEEFGSLDVLVNNAGTFSMTREVTADGFELTFGTNHLGPFHLTHLLLPMLNRGREPRIVFVGSDAYKFGRLRFDDLQMIRRYGGFRAYAASRLATVLVNQVFARRLEPMGITVNCCHPGHVQTNIWPATTGVMRFAMKFAARSRITAVEGAQPSLFLATDPGLAQTSGVYFDRMTPVVLKPRFTDQTLLDQLWNTSCELTQTTSTV